MLNINQLRMFYETAKCQNTTVASKKLHVTQPAVSIQIKLFEESCGLKLFERNGRRIVLTQSGHFILQHCHALFNQERKIEREIRNLHELKTGAFKFGTTRTCAHGLMLPYINKFHLLYPGVKFILDEGDSKRMASTLLNFENEVVIVTKMENLKGVKFEPFLRLKVVLFASPAHRFAKRKKGVQFKELEGESIVMKDNSSSTNTLIKKTFFSRGITPHMALEIDNIACIMQIVRKGEDVSFLVRSALEEKLKQGHFQIIPILDEDLYVDIFIAYLDSRTLSFSANAFLKILRETECKSGSWSRLR